MANPPKLKTVVTRANEARFFTMKRCSVQSKICHKLNCRRFCRNSLRHTAPNPNSYFGITHPCYSATSAGNFRKGTNTQIQNPAVRVWSPIGRHDNYGLAIGLIGNFDPRSKWKRWMGSDHCSRVHWSTIGHCLPSVAVRSCAVEASFAAGRSSRLCREGAKQQEGNQKTEHQ